MTVQKVHVLSFFRENIKKPLSFRDIVSLMQLSRSESRALKRTLRTLVREGSLVLTRKGLYGPPDDMNLVTGFFERHRDGYGFLIPEKPGQRDIFIPARATTGAFNNDKVIARVDNWQKREGRILRVLERTQSRIAGTFEVTRTGYYVKPKDKTLTFDFFVSRKDKGKSKHGDTVVAEITSYPTDRKHPSARVIKIIKKPTEPKAETEAIIDEFNLPRTFIRSVLDESRRLYRQSQRRGGQEDKGRKDLRSLSTVTIDGERAKDFDDAVSIRITRSGYLLFVHIADVSYYVRENSSIDSEARERATSVYFPDRVLPMLPQALSEDLCSLKPHTDRFAITAEIAFDRSGTRLNAQFYPSIIMSDERMTYTSVKKILIDSDQRERKKYDHLLQEFELMGELCSILRQKRLKRGSLDFDLPEPEVLLDLKGHPENIVRAERNFAHMMIEEFMIAANEAVAEYLTELGVPLLYRIHEEPDPVKLEDTIKFLRTFIRIKPRLKPKDFSSLLRGIRSIPEEETVHSLILRSLKQARYSHMNVGHFGLASPCYTHFTSPIRRYPDLVVHRILRTCLQKGHPSNKRIQRLNEILPEIAFHASRTERIAEKAETTVINAMRAWFMKDKIGEQFDAKVINVSPYGIKIRLKEYFVEGFIHVSYLTDDFYHYSERTFSLRGRHTRRSFSIGKEVIVRLDRVDMNERELIFDIVKVL